MREIIDIAKALSDPSRVRILLALKGRELCVCQIVELLELAASTVSKHMAVLRQAYLVENRKNGRWTYYRRCSKGAPKRAIAALRWLDSSIDANSIVSEDATRIEEILLVPTEEKCSTAKKN